MTLSIPVHIGGNGLDYELLDTGGFEKLERFGKYVVRRPEPQALWNKHLSEKEWDELAHASYRRLKSSHYRDSDESGAWALAKGVKEPWYIEYKINNLRLKFKLGFTSFKHVGIFPEQTCNWDWVYRELNGKENPSVLNLFAYTGGASLVARAAGAEVVHLDSVKSMISWARENMELSGLDGIRWVVEDTVKFVDRERRRQHKYDLVIMDPPAYGRGPSGEKWILEPMLWPLLLQVKSLLKENGKLLLNLYSLNHSALVVANAEGKSHWGESALKDRAGRLLPLGVFGVIC